MARELINRITIKKDGVYVSTHSSNDDSPYHSVKVDFLSKAYNEKGQSGLDLEVIKLLCECGELRGNHHSLEKYRYALNSPSGDEIYKYYTDKINEYYESLNEDDKKTVWSPNKTENAQKYCDYSNFMRNEMYCKFAKKCSEYDFIVNKIKEENDSNNSKFSYYQRLFSKVLDVSDDYNIDFHSKSPFQDFGDDEESAYNGMYSFSKYYEEILKKFNIKVNDIKTESWSDGKYIITLNNSEVLNVAAWDSINSVIDNVESMRETLKEKESEMSYE